MKKILFLFMMLVGFTSLYASPPIGEKVQLNNDENLLLKTSASASAGDATADGKIIISQRDTLRREWVDENYNLKLQVEASAMVHHDGVC